MKKMKLVSMPRIRKLNLEHARFYINYREAINYRRHFETFNQIFSFFLLIAIMVSLLNVYENETTNSLLTI